MKWLRSFLSGRTNSGGHDASLEQAYSLSTEAREVYSNGRYQAAARLWEATVEIMQRVLGPQHPDTVAIRSNLAVAYRELGRYEEALVLWETTFEIRQRVLGPEHPQTLDSRSNLAIGYRGLGRYEEAVEIGEMTLEVSQRVLGPEHPDTLASRNDLAVTYGDLGRYEEALGLLEATLETRQRVLGAEHRETLVSRNNLSTGYSALGRYEEAVGLNEGTLDIRQKVLGPEHPVTLTSRTNLAIGYRDLGRHEEAMALDEVTLEISYRVLGSKHPDTLVRLSNLASGYSYLGRFEEAFGLDQLCLDLRKKVLGPGHPDTLGSGYNLAATYRALGQYEQAVALGKVTLEMRQEVLGSEHLDTLWSRNNLAIGYRDLGRHEEAMALDEVTLEIRQMVLGNEHPDTLTSRNNLAVGYRDLGRYQEAVALDEATLEVRQRVLGSQHSDTLNSRSNLAGGLRDIGRYEEAVKFWEMTLEIRQGVLGPDHRDTLASRSNLAMGYRELGMYEEAVGLWEVGLEAWQRVQGPEHPDTLNGRNNLAGGYRDLGRYEEALRLFEETLDQCGKSGNAYSSPDTAWRSLYGIAVGNKDNGDVNSALQRFQEAIHALEQVFARLSLEESRMALESDRIGLYREAGELALDMGRVDLAYELLQGSKASSFTDSIAVQTASTSVSEDSALGIQLGELEIQIYGLHRRAFGLPGGSAGAVTKMTADSTDEDGETLARLGQLNQEHSRLLERIRRDDIARYALQPGARLTREEVQKSLGQSEVLLDYFRLSDSRQVCFVLDGEPRPLTAVDVHEIPVGRIPGYLNTLWTSAPQYRGDRVVGASYQFDQLHALGGELLGDDARSRVSNFETILISPYSFLSYVPWWALPRHPNEGEGVVIDQHQVGILPSAGILVHLRNKKAVFEGQGGYLGIGVDGDGNIPLVELEVLLAKRRHFPNGEVKLGSEGKASLLWEQPGHHSVLHIASHGSASPPSLLLWGEDGPTPLILSNAMYRTRVRADLIILDGCFTGRVETRRADEFFGIARGLMVRTGARAMVVTLWECGELEGMLFTDALLESYVSGATLGEAMQSATNLLAQCTVEKVINWLEHRDLEELAHNLAESVRVRLGDYLAKFRKLDRPERAFPDVQQWAPFFILGDPSVRYSLNYA